MTQSQAQVPPQVLQQCREFRQTFARLREEVSKVIVGHGEIVDDTLICLFCGGHVLLEGVPGLGKTLLVRTLASALSLSFRRIQFTPDLMPADIIGTNVVMEDKTTGRRAFEFQRGPIFGQVILADEINRATPKTQSAMLEAMQERSVTSGGTVYKLDEPFLVLATQNPIEQEGTYPLPEAQLDRFFFKLLVPYSNREELRTILDRTTTGHTPQVQAVLDGAGILAGQQLARRVAVAEHVQDFAIRLVLATHPGGEFAADITNRYVRFGSSPRGVQALVLAAKVRAVLDERYHVSFQDIEQSLLPALRHRLIVNFEAQAEGITTDAVLKEVLDKTPKTMATA
ncbi:MAG: ATPase RavA [Planctomycetes bacterium ADurb.Bin126]|nr:MAG: ATPase RavA [Planctomycetes bacterium ADurb.Bin126]HOD81991.1 MoxR family ATPase [Phycisphaerae bacterium]HQL74261.1 MoxR family ATPase [Phycisphaerae bacterium]